eukprot:7381731-Prymnesium_polylepis.1
MHAAGAIPLLVELLRPDGEDESCTAENAAGALQNLAWNDGPRKAVFDAVFDAGAVGPLVSLLRFESEAAQKAADALDNLSCNAAYAAAILDALPSALPQAVRSNKDLLDSLCVPASAGLDAAEAATDVAALEQAIERARL